MPTFSSLLLSTTITVASLNKTTALKFEKLTLSTKLNKSKPALSLGLNLGSRRSVQEVQQKMNASTEEQRRKDAEAYKKQKEVQDQEELPRLDEMYNELNLEEPKSESKDGDAKLKELQQLDNIIKNCRKKIKPPISMYDKDTTHLNDFEKCLNKLNNPKVVESHPTGSEGVVLISKNFATKIYYGRARAAFQKEKYAYFNIESDKKFTPRFESRNIARAILFDDERLILLMKREYGVEFNDIFNSMLLHNIMQQHNSSELANLSTTKSKELWKIFKDNYIGNAKNMIQLMNDIRLALGHIHEKGVLHTDLKFENVVLVPGENDEILIPKIIDFGQAILSSKVEIETKKMNVDQFEPLLRGDLQTNYKMDGKFKTEDSNHEFRLNLEKSYDDYCFFAMAMSMLSISKSADDKYIYIDVGEVGERLRKAIDKNQENLNFNLMTGKLEMAKLEMAFKTIARALDANRNDCGRLSQLFNNYIKTDLTGEISLWNTIFVVESVVRKTGAADFDVSLDPELLGLSTSVRSKQNSPSPSLRARLPTLLGSPLKEKNSTPFGSPEREHKSTPVDSPMMELDQMDLAKKRTPSFPRTLRSPPSSMRSSRRGSRGSDNKENARERSLSSTPGRVKLPPMNDGNINKGYNDFVSKKLFEGNLKEFNGKLQKPDFIDIPTSPLPWSGLITPTNGKLEPLTTPTTGLPTGNSQLYSDFYKDRYDIEFDFYSRGKNLQTPTGQGSLENRLK